MTNAEILKNALRTIHFRSDFNIGGEWEDALDGLIAELDHYRKALERITLTEPIGEVAYRIAREALNPTGDKLSPSEETPKGDK
jgi:hypothetical protein